MDVHGVGTRRGRARAVRVSEPRPGPDPAAVGRRRRRSSQAGLGLAGRARLPSGPAFRSAHLAADAGARPDGVRLHVARWRCPVVLPEKPRNRNPQPLRTLSRGYRELPRRRPRSNLPGHRDDDRTTCRHRGTCLEGEAAGLHDDGGNRRRSFPSRVLATHRSGSPAATKPATRGNTWAGSTTNGSTPTSRGSAAWPAKTPRCWSSATTAHARCTAASVSTNG